jgi:hypothetical protein
MFDAIGKRIEYQDRVVFSNSGGETSTLLSGQVIGFTEKKIRIRTPRPLWQRESRGEFMEILKFPEQLAVVEKNNE